MSRWLTVSFLAIVLSILGIIPLAYSDVFTAVGKLKEVFDLESQFLEEIKKYLAKQSESGRGLEDEWHLVFDRVENQNLRDKSKTKLTENPIDCYHLLRRFTTELQPLLTFITCPECEEWETVNAKELKSKVSAGKRSGIWPEESDASGAARSLVRLSRVYALNLTELIDGKIRRHKTDLLTDDEVLDIVQSVPQKDWSYEKVQWIRAGIVRAISQGNNQSAIRFYRRLAGIYYEAGLPWVAEQILDESKSKLPTDERIEREVEFYKRKAAKTPADKRTGAIQQTFRPGTFWKHYERLCRGRKGLYRRGFCQYRRTWIPIYVAKEEVLSLDPRISMFHDVIYEEEMEHIKTITLERLFRSVVVSNTPTSDQRISQSAWWRDFEDTIVKRMTNRIELISGLSLVEKALASHSEALQVLNYGIGGMYEPHYDFFNVSSGAIPNQLPELRASGDRLATWLFYLNEVEEGGATVFPEVNVRVPVKKGSAAFWYNLRRDSSGDDRTLHAGCPVLLGSKWVSNKWIRYNGNLFTSKCGLQDSSLYDP